MQRSRRWFPAGELSALFFLHGVAMAAWYVPLSPVLAAHGQGGLTAYAFATTAVAALLTPLVFGSIADRLAAPVVVFRWASVGGALLTALASLAIERGWGGWVVLGLIQAQALVVVPTWSLATSIVLGRLENPARHFGAVRAFGTFGWIAGCLLVSALGADASPRAGYLGAVVWMAVVGLTLVLPAVAPVRSRERLSVRQRLGIDALDLLRKKDHRVVFLTAGLLSVPLAAFYPYAPAHLRSLGFEHTSAWMSLAQVTEVVAMFGLAGLLHRWRLKWILLSGLGFAVLRYVLLAHGGAWVVLVGISLHGFAFTLFFVAAPIYLNARVDVAWRARAQALLSLVTQGVGNLVGYLGAGWWQQACSHADGMRWSLFWGGLAGLTGMVFLYFLAAYRGEAAPSSGREVQQVAA